MSDREYQYVTSNQKQTRQFQHEQNIQNRKSLDKSLDRLNDSMKTNKPQTHNVNVYHH